MHVKNDTEIALKEIADYIKTDKNEFQKYSLVS